MFATADKPIVIPVTAYIIPLLSHKMAITKIKSVYENTTAIFSITKITKYIIMLIGSADS